MVNRWALQLERATRTPRPFLKPESLGSALLAYVDSRTRRNPLILCVGGDGDLGESVSNFFPTRKLHNYVPLGHYMKVSFKRIMLNGHKAT